MKKESIYNYIKEHSLAVLATASSGNKPGAALVGIAVTEGLEIIFDTVKTSRKYLNLIQNPEVALVIGWDNETTVQYEGVATELTGDDADRLKEIYFNTFPEGRRRAKTWPGIIYFKIVPKWIRYSNFNEPQTIEEISF